MLSRWARAAGFSLLARAESKTHNPASIVAFSCSDSSLTASFRWAKAQALAYAFDGDPVGPWYEAALPGREAFCMRDVSHQAMGAHVLGLAPYTRNMLLKFAQNIAESRDWCSYWEINRYNRPAPVDYKSDSEFWYCLPANYDVLDACYRMYQWTGDAAYVSHPAFLNFYARTVSDYERRWDLGLDRIMRRRRVMNVRGRYNSEQPFEQFRGNPGYDEGTRGYVLGVDLLATQYAAYRSYSAIQNVRRNEPSARLFSRKAAAVKELVNNSWWDASAGQFYSFLDQQHRFAGHAEASLLYRDVIDAGPRLSATLEALERQIRKTPSIAVEGESHLPEILYRYNNASLAQSEILDLTRTGRDRREYPEVSYAVAGAMVTGLVGVNVEAKPLTASDHSDLAGHRIRTLSGLGPLSWAEITNLPVQANQITVRQEAPSKTSLTNQSGPALFWRPYFRGSQKTVIVDGKPRPAHPGRDLAGKPLYYVDLTVSPGATVRAEAAA